MEHEDAQCQTQAIQQSIPKTPSRKYCARDEDMRLANINSSNNNSLSDE
jgi:hypothetical protein